MEQARPLTKRTPNSAVAPSSAPAWDRSATQVRLLVVLVLSFAVVPGALLLSVGVLVLAFGHQAHDYVFGVLILSLAATLIAGITATFLYVQRGTSLARLQTEFVSKVSHDLRTPLTSIRMFVETLRDGRIQEPDKVRECLDVLSDETERLTAMVERLLRWARMEAGKRLYEPTPVPVETLVQATIKALEPQLVLYEQSGGVNLVVHVPSDLPMVNVDVAAMSEALLNLLQNALRHMGPKREIALRAQLRDKEVELSVSDQGPGIAKHEQRRIFEKFYRVVDPANPNVEGTGLGLAIVHHVVRAHQGRITVDSEIGRGATFNVFLPALEKKISG